MKTTALVLVPFLSLGLQSARPQGMDSQVDMSFDAGSCLNGPVYASTVLPNGKILVAGTFSVANGITTEGVALLHTNGATDLTFTNGFMSLWPSYFNFTVDVYTMAVQPDGKIIIGGHAGDLWDPEWCGLIRLNADGSWDWDFSAWDFSATVRSLALQRSGKIIVGGDFQGWTPPGWTSAYLSRSKTDGTVDPTFLYNLSGPDGPVTAVAVQPDDRVLVAGDFTTVNGYPSPGIARLLPEGELDPSFSASVVGQVKSFAVQPDGKIVIAGNFTSVNGVSINRIARLNANGSLDTAFSAGRTGADSTVYALVLQPDGKILAGGTFWTMHGSVRPCVARINTDGSLDSSFSAGDPGPWWAVFSLAIQPNGQVIIGGALSAVNSIPIANVARLSATGALDTNFSNGRVFFTSGVSCLVTQSNGRILANGRAGTGIGRLKPDGSTDSTFLQGKGALGTVNAIALHTQDRILVGGDFAKFNGADYRALVRLNADGSTDPGFENGLGGTSGRINAVAVQADDKIIIGGYFESVKGAARTNLARLNPDGRLDTAFLSLGVGPDADVTTIVIEPGGRILIGGAFTTVNGIDRPGLARLYPDGTLDASFQTNSAGIQGTVYAIVVQSDGKILIGGSFSSVNGNAVQYLARLNSDGTLDATFNPGTVTGWVRALALQKDGRILVGGEFDEISGSKQARIGRLRPDGSVDGFMLPPYGADGTVMAIAMLDDNRMLLGGSFGSLKGLPRRNVARVFYQMPTTPIDVALNNSTLSWTNDAVALWFGQTNMSHDLTAAAQTGSIAENQSTALQTAVKGPGTLRFWWKISSEELFDRLVFTAVAEWETNSASISGEADWQERIVCLPEGMNTLQWTYRKDSEGNEGLDMAWIDQVSFTPGYSAPIVVTDPVSQTNVAGGSAGLSAWVVGSSPLSYQWLLNGVEIPGATNGYYSIESVVPEMAGIYSLRVSNPYGSVTTAGAQLFVISTRAYGQNDCGQTAISNLTDVVAIAAGQNHSLLLRAGGTIFACGDDTFGQCSPPASLGPVIGVAGGGGHSLAITDARTVVGWGNNSDGQISVPAEAHDVTAVAAGFWHSLALRADGTVVGWGDNSFGQAAVPPEATNIVAIAAGGDHSLALRADGTVVGWGKNTDAQGVWVGQSTVPWSLNQVVSIGAGEYHSLAVTRDGNIVAWGDNSYGQCNVPSNAVPAAAVVGGGTHSLARLRDATAVAWGDNSYNQCQFSQYLTNIVALAAGNAHSLQLFGLRPPQQLRDCSSKANHFSVQVPTFSDRLYSLEYSSSLESTNWLALPLVRGLGELQTLTDPGIIAGQRYYRVRQW